MRVTIEKIVSEPEFIRANDLKYDVLYVICGGPSNGAIVTRFYNRNPSLRSLIKVGDTPSSHEDSRHQPPFHTTWEVESTNDVFKFSECEYKVTLCNKSS